MNRDKVLREWTTRVGYPALILVNEDSPGSPLWGYVQVPPEHPLFLVELRGWPSSYGTCG